MDKVKIKSLLIYKNATIKQAMQKLNETAEKILFVVDEKNRLLGTVTDGDIRRGLINGQQFTDTIEQVIHKAFISVSFNATGMEREAKRLMVENKIEHIPVLADEKTIVDVISWPSMLAGKEQPQKRIYPNDVVVMAGGKGTRLDPFTRILPKPLIPLGEKPIIEVIMERFYKSGFSKFIYTLNYKKEYLKLFLRESTFPYTIDWVEEDEYLGTAGSLSLLKDKLKESFFVTNCDSIMTIDMAEVLAWHKEHQAAITIIGCHNEVKIPFGVLKLSNSKLDQILEKPIQDIIVNTGVYVMEPHVLSYISEGKPIDMNQLIELISKKEIISVYPISEGWFDVGQWEEYKIALQKIHSQKGDE